jgi:hypothetical protein
MVRVASRLGLQRRSRSVNDLSLADIQAEYAQRNAAEVQP